MLDVGRCAHLALALLVYACPFSLSAHCGSSSHGAQRRRKLGSRARHIQQRIQACCGGTIPAPSGGCGLTLRCWQPLLARMRRQRAAVGSRSQHAAAVADAASCPPELVGP
eukprot:347075-Chlamydomonas_euryale.AAC.12